MSRKFTGNVERDAHGFLTVMLPSNDWTEGSTVEVRLVSLPKNKPPHRNPPPAPYAGVVCEGLGGDIPACGRVDLTKEQYDEQMKYPDRTWRCPQCRAEAWFDDARFEQLQGIS
jgi:hypothetical protein